MTVTQIQEKTSDHDRPFELYSSLPYYISYVAYSLMLIGIYYRNQLIVIQFIYGLLPLADKYFTWDLVNPTKAQEKELKRLPRFKIPLMLLILTDWVVFVYGIWHLMENSNGLLYNACFLYVLANLQGISVNFSHELLHKSNLFDNVIAVINLSKNLHLYWYIEHKYGHHKTVATPEDPASAVKGQTVYDFIPKSLYGGFVSAWKIEERMVKESNRPFYLNRNYLTFIPISIIPMVFYYFLGLKGMILQIIVGLSGPLYLEIVNYLEHYGLRRKEISKGVYEEVNIYHSWNSPHRITNYFLFKLQRHSDHHANALKPYQVLCSYDESPTLPSGYALCIMLALFPSKWFEVMDPIVDAYQKDKKVSKEIYNKSQKTIDDFVFKINIVFSCLMVIQIVLNQY